MNELLRKELPWALILTLLCLSLYLPCLGNRDLWGSVEPQYAEVARETLVDGHWMIPHYNGTLYTFKPPFYPWLIALTSIPVGDVTEFTARLPSALSALGMILLVYFLGKELLGQRAGLLAALILISSPQFYKSACMVRIDMPLAFLATASMTALYLGLARPSTAYYLLGWFLATLASMLKGPLVPLVMATVVLIYLCSKRDFRLLISRWTALGALISVATFSAWLLPVYFGDGRNYINEMYILLSAYTTHEYHTESIYFYLPELLGIGPWVLLIPVAIFMFFRDRVEGLRLPCVWFLVMLFVFSMIATKHSRYLLPLYPAAALLAAFPLDRYVSKSAPSWPGLKAFPLLLFAVIVGVEIALLSSGCLPFPVVSLAAGVVCLLLAIFFAQRAGQFHLVFWAVLLVMVAFGVGRNQFLLPGENEKRSEKALCQDIINHIEPGAEWGVYDNLRAAYIFYTRTYPRSLVNEKSLAEFFSSDKKVYCLISEEKLKKLELPVTEAARLKGTDKHNTVFMLISNR